MTLIGPPDLKIKHLMLFSSLPSSVVCVKYISYYNFNFLKSIIKICFIILSGVARKGAAGLGGAPAHFLQSFKSAF